MYDLQQCPIEPATACLTLLDMACDESYEHWAAEDQAKSHLIRACILRAMGQLHGKFMIIYYM